MEKLNLDRVSLRKFGITMGIAFFVIASIIFLKRGTFNYPVITISSLFFASGLFLPVFLKPVYIFWMKLARVLSWINTRLLLIIIYYIVFTPIGFILKLAGKDLIDIKINKAAGSYWIEKEKQSFKPEDYLRQF